MTENSHGPSDPQNPPTPRFGGPVLFPQLYLWLVFVSVLDIVFTVTILSLGGHEVNPIADWFLDLWDTWGLIVLKFLAISFAITLCEIIGRMRYMTGLRFAQAAIGIGLIPVVVAIVQLVLYTWF